MTRSPSEVELEEVRATVLGVLDPLDEAASDEAVDHVADGRRAVAAFGDQSRGRDRLVEVGRRQHGEEVGRSAASNIRRLTSAPTSWLALCSSSRMLRGSAMRRAYDFVTVPSAGRPGPCAAAHSEVQSSRAQRLFSALATAVRNENVRRVELAWGAAIAAEWAHFVALGVFAYEQGGAAAVGIAGLVRLLPAAAVAPFAASLGDRFRRERFLLAMALVGGAALAGTAVAAFADQTSPRLRARGRRRALVHADQARAAGAPPVARPDAGRADRGERCHVDDREPRNPRRAGRRGRARLGRGRRRASSSSGPAPWSLRQPSWRGSASTVGSSCPPPTTGEGASACSWPGSERSPRAREPGCSSGSSWRRPSSAAA